MAAEILFARVHTTVLCPYYGLWIGADERLDSIRNLLWKKYRQLKYYCLM